MRNHAQLAIVGGFQEPHRRLQERDHGYMRSQRTRSRQGHPTAIVVGLLTAFLIGCVALVVVRSDGTTKNAKPIVATTTLPTVTTTTLGATRYTVQPGDVLVTIAERLGIPVSVILDANDLTNPDALVAGQVLKIPPPRVPVLVVKPATIPVGGGVTIRLTGAQRDEQVTFEINSPTTQFVGQSHVATKGGKVITSYSLDPDDVPGTYTVIARGDQSTVVQTTFVVEPAA
jgi:LysM repeat protein